MDMVFAGAKWNYCLVYIDDILIFSEAVDEHIDHIDQVLKRIAKFGLRLKPSKCDFFKPQLLFLGHIVSADGIRPNPAKVKAIMGWPEPKTRKEVESFLGLAGYYRKFIKGFSSLAEPLFKLKSSEWTWNEDQRW